MSANVRETYAAVSKRKQSALGTANPETDFIQVRKTNSALATVEIVNEDDSAELGKGDEFPTTLYPSYRSIEAPIECYLTSEMMAWAAVFGLGNVVKTGVAPNLVYTCTPSAPISADIDLLPFSYAEVIRPGGNFHDLIAVGCVLDTFQLQVQSGPGRESTKLSIGIVGTGKSTEPSGLDFANIPIPYTALPAYGATITILGTDYTATGRIISLEFGWNNNLRRDSGYYPGSGKQGNHQIRGRMEHGDRAITLNFTARMTTGAAERTALSNLTSGTAVITIPGPDANNEVTITCHQVRFRQAQPGDTDGIVHIAGEMSVQKHTTNGVVTIVAKCNVDDIGALTA